MIKIISSYNDIIPLWREAFGDSDEEIRFFTDNVRNAECAVYETDGNIASMLFLVDCSVGGVKGKYIFAACTFEKYKGRGYMTELLEFCKNRCAFLCLIPANDALMDFYEKRGFTEKIQIESISFSETPEITEYLLEGYNLTVPAALIYKGE